jgi:hypothetical protein
VLTTTVDSHISVPALAALARLVLLIFLQVPSIGDPNAGPYAADAGLHTCHALPFLVGAIPVVTGLVGLVLPVLRQSASPCSDLRCCCSVVSADHLLVTNQQLTRELSHQQPHLLCAFWVLMWEGVHVSKYHCAKHSTTPWMCH